MSIDSQQHQLRFASNRFHPTTRKALTLSLALMLGACASTGDKALETETREQADVAQSTAASKEPAPTAAELMKTLQAPLKEPEPAKSEKTAAAAASVKKAKTETAKDSVVQKVDKVVEKPVQKTVEKAEQSAESAAVSTTAVTKDIERKAAVVTAPETTVSSSEAASVANKAADPVIEQQTVAVVSEPGQISGAKPFSVTAKQLPFSYDLWTIRKGNTPLTQGLVIVTPTWEMGKEGYMSQIWLTLMEDKIHINSSSDIEAASKSLGIRIDGGDLIPFSSIAETNIGVVEGRWLDRLSRAEKIEIYLGFFPGKKPTSDTFKSDLSMSNLDRVVATYRLLNR